MGTSALKQREPRTVAPDDTLSVRPQSSPPIIRGRAIVCVASSWDQDPTSKHHVMRVLARHNDVVWVNYHGTRRPTLSLADMRSSISTLSRILRGSRPVSPTMIQTTPFVLPAVGDGIVGDWNHRSLIWQIRRALARRNGVAGHPVQVWTFAPDVAFLAGQLNEERFVYYCVDEFAQFQGNDARMIAARERLLLAKSDVVITSSQALYEAKKQLHDNVHLVRHGVNLEHFAAAMSPHVDIPASVARLQGPVVGFFGLLHHWVDVELIADVARRLPDWHLVLIGQVFANVKPLRRLKNVHLLGRVSYHDLPRYCARFDVAMLPFKRDAFTRYINPIKLLEYLAAGLPVVSTSIPEAAYYVPEVTLADTADEFARACRDAVGKGSIQQRVRRSQCAVHVGWDAVVARISRIVMQADPRSGKSHRGHADPPAPVSP